MLVRETHLQFCSDGQDITGDFYAEQDATEVRLWTEDGTCIGAVTLACDGWHASASDECDWVTLADVAHRTWRDALEAVVAAGDVNCGLPGCPF